MAVIGAALAFAANGLSPRGLELSRNYFPGAQPAFPASGGATQPANAARHKYQSTRGTALRQAAGRRPATGGQQPGGAVLSRPAPRAGRGDLY